MVSAPQTRAPVKDFINLDTACRRYYCCQFWPWRGYSWGIEYKDRQLGQAYNQCLKKHQQYPSHKKQPLLCFQPVQENFITVYAKCNSRTMTAKLGQRDIQKGIKAWLQYLAIMLAVGP
uniref:Uncharacterized protein n=1 Tax=Sphaerodactylus townsendi TaxID=933632 RepID=A0ACB8EKF0_9SAUR